LNGVFLYWQEDIRRVSSCHEWGAVSVYPPLLDVAVPAVEPDLMLNSERPDKLLRIPSGPLGTAYPDAVRHAAGQPAFLPGMDMHFHRSAELDPEPRLLSAYEGKLPARGKMPKLHRRFEDFTHACLLG
jgi:hypothetical protein